MWDKNGINIGIRIEFKFTMYICTRFENFSQNTLNYYLSNKFEMNKQMIRGIREYINADAMNKDWIKNNLNKQYNKQYNKHNIINI